MPDTRPDTPFTDGVCQACITFEKRPQIDWATRKAELLTLLDQHHGRCIVPSSGGKDSTYQAITLKELGADVTVVTARTCHLTPIGRQNIAAFAARPQHFYLLRMVEAPRAPPPLPDHHIIATRGPFSLEEDLALMRAHRISWVVSKNAGGPQAGAKIEAARQLGLPVTLIARPPIPPRPRAETVDEALDWLMGAHGPRLGV
jgi:precorrin-6x reductase